MPQRSFETHFVERTFGKPLLTRAHLRPGTHLRAGAQTGKYGMHKQNTVPGEGYL